VQPREPQANRSMAHDPDAVDAEAPAVLTARGGEGQHRPPPRRYAEEAIPLRSPNERGAARESEATALRTSAGRRRWRSLAALNVPRPATPARSVLALAGLAAIGLVLVALTAGGSAPRHSPENPSHAKPRPTPMARVPLAPQRAKRPRMRARTQLPRRQPHRRHPSAHRHRRQRSVATAAHDTTAPSVPPEETPVAESPAPEPPPPPPVSSSPNTPPPQGQEGQLEQQFGFER
jgi:hypothetical protein